jgi:hypothetical protein
VALRRSWFEDHTFDRSVTGFTTRITLTWLSNDAFGVVEPKPEPEATAFLAH